MNIFEKLNLWTCLLKKASSETSQNLQKIDFC